MKRINQACMLLLLSLFWSGCKKETDNVTVYQPPGQTISFSDVSDFIIDSTGKTIALKAMIRSGNDLQKVEILYEPWAINKTITTFADPKSYALNEGIMIPAGAALKIHSILIKATDKNGLSNFTEIKVGLQDLNFTKLYMAIGDEAALNADLFGVPMVMDKAGSHTYELIYYSRTENTSMRFIPNKSSFTPVAIGIDPNNAQKLITDAARSLPVVITEKGYHKITVNTLMLTYSVEKFEPVGTAVDQVAIVGRGFYDFPNMDWQNTLPDIILLDKDADNPYLFTKLLNVGVPPGQVYNTAQFVLTTNNGWTNFWRFDQAESPELAVFNAGMNAEMPISTTPVSYLFIFDSFTARTQAIKQ
jgi:hypothetical protein